MRIVGGALRGRRLEAPGTNDTRPTADRIRQAVFNIIEHAIADFTLDGAHALDLFAGTGALGFEALSRGAATCIFIDNDTAACRLITRNAAALGLSDRVSVMKRDATLLREAQGDDGGRRLVLLDPPYGRDLAGAAIISGLNGGWLAPDALIVAEEYSDYSISWPPLTHVIDRRSWGRASVTFARVETPP